MKSVRCGQCGFLSFADAGACKRCRAPLGAGSGADVADVANVADDTYADADDGVDVPARRGPLARALRTPAVVVLGALVLAAVAGSLLLRRGASAPPYAELIRGSAPFSEPMTVKVNQRALPDGSERFALRAVPEAYALEHLGLLRIAERKVRVEVQRAAPARPLFRDDPEIAYMTELSVDIELTAEGREAASGWEVSSQGRGKYEIDWWHVPVGRRELVSVGAAGPGPRAKGEPEVWAVDFKWRWVPDEIGSVFDRGDTASAELPARARHSYLARLDSRREYDGLAWFTRKGEAWEVVEVFCNAHRDQIDGKLYPVANTDPYGF